MWTGWSANAPEPHRVVTHERGWLKCKSVMSAKEWRGAMHGGLSWIAAASIVVNGKVLQERQVRVKTKEDAMRKAEGLASVMIMDLWGGFQHLYDRIDFIDSNAEEEAFQRRRGWQRHRGHLEGHK